VQHVAPLGAGVREGARMVAWCEAGAGRGARLRAGKHERDEHRDESHAASNPQDPVRLRSRQEAAAMLARP
jgi:hypothetical protein